jgi:hypothetical protein
VKHDSPTSSAGKPADTAALDALTGGAFTAPTTGERAARIRDWLQTEPSAEQMAEVFREISHRDKGASKPLKEKLDEIKRQKAQESIAVEWAEKANALLAQARLNVADAMGWQRDAAKAGAPLSREPLAGLKAALVERLKAIEDLQTQVQVAREAAVLLAQRIEVMSTKPLSDSQHAREALSADVSQWVAQAQALAGEVQWDSIDTRFAPMLETSRAQLLLVWQAFDAALAQAAAALADGSAALPAVPVWADEIRLARGEPLAPVAPIGMSDEEREARRTLAAAAVQDAVKHVAAELEQGHTKGLPRLVQELRGVLKEHGRWLNTEQESSAQALLAQAGDLEGWQRWRADQLRNELLQQAEQLLKTPEDQRLGGRKMQDTLRSLRERWKQTDQGGVPNHALWKRFDEACTQAHHVVEQWLDQLKAEGAAHRAQRLALIAELDAWTQAHENHADWKAQARDLHQMSEAWRNAGHLSEKQFAELQPQWKAAMARARAPLERVQADNLARRQALIEEAQALGAAPMLRMDAVRALQQQWQHEAQSVPLDRRQEQKLWDAFRKPIDDAFARKSAEREKQTAALSAHDQQVLAAARALDEANASHDAQRIQAAMSALNQALSGGAGTPPVEAVAQSKNSEEKQAPALGDKEIVASPSDDPGSPAVAAEDGAVAAAPAVAPAPKRVVVAVRGDDRPGMKRSEPVAARGRPGEGRRDGGDRGADRRSDRGPGRGAERGNDRGFARDAFEPRAPRLGDAAFRAQREALENAQAALRKLAAQAHGQALTQVLDAWKQRDAQAVPSASDLGSRVSAATRAAWVQAVSAPVARAVGTELLRLEMAAEVPTPAAHVDARRALQLQLLTRRNDPPPPQTWGADAARVLACAWDEESALRLQNALKALLRKV